MRIVTINYSGNLGKTTICAHLLKPRIAGATVVSVDTLNSGLADEGVAAQTLRADQFTTLREALFLEEAMIVDVGSSGVEVFTKMMAANKNCHEDVDAFVVPVVMDKKQLKDTVETVLMLQSIGTDPKKIKLVFNRVDVAVNVEDEFPEIFAFARDSGVFVSPEAVIYENEFFPRNTLGVTLQEMVNDTTDYRALARATTNQEERQRYAMINTLRGLALSANDNLDKVFNAVFPELTKPASSKAKKSEPQTAAA